MKKAILLTILLASFALAQDFTFEGIQNPSTVGQKYTITITATEGTGTANLRLVVGGTPYEYVVPSSIDFGGSTEWTDTIEFTFAATNVQLRCVDPNDGDIGNSDPFDIDPGPAAKWQILAPGETAAPGTTAGKTGTGSVTAGGDNAYTINICDTWYNVLTSASGTPELETTDPFGALPATPAVGNNTIQLRTVTEGQASSTQTVTVSGGSYTSNVSNVTVNVGTATQLIILCNGETALQGDDVAIGVRGKSGEPVDATLGGGYLVDIRAVDACWNWVPDYNETNNEVNVFAGSVDLTDGTTDEITGGVVTNVDVDFKTVAVGGENIDAEDSYGLKTPYSTEVGVLPGVDSLVVDFVPSTVPVGVHADLEARAWVASKPLTAGSADVELIEGSAVHFHLDTNVIKIENGFGSVEAWADSVGTYIVEVTSGEQVDTDTLIVEERLGVTVIPNPYKYGAEGVTDIKFSYKVAEAGAAEIVLLIADIYGNVVYKATYGSSEPEALPGTQEIAWNGTNSNGNRIASGMYQVVMKITLTDLSSQVVKKNFMVIW